MSVEKCLVCNGTGHRRQDPPYQKCPSCNGTGKVAVVLTQCPVCKGRGGQIPSGIGNTRHSPCW